MSRSPDIGLLVLATLALREYRDRESLRDCGLDAYRINLQRPSY